MDPNPSLFILNEKNEKKKEKNHLTLEQQPPNIRLIMTKVCTHIGIVVCARAEIPNARPFAAPASRWGRASILVFRRRKGWSVEGISSAVAVKQGCTGGGGATNCEVAFIEGLLLRLLRLDPLAI